MVAIETSGNLEYETRGSYSSSEHALLQLEHDVILNWSENKQEV